MSSVAGRKKSMISATTPTIESPVANNTLLNKAASQSTSLYQQCSALRSRLMHIQDFSEWLSLSSPDSSRGTDPVTQLWHCFRLGVPLCYLFNLLSAPYTSISIDTDPSSFDAVNEKAMKRAILLFSMQIKQIDGCEQFTVTDLWNLESTDGFVKVVNNVINLVGCLPEDVFVEPPPSSPALASAQQSTESLTSESGVTASSTDGGARFNIIKELVETERKYVQDLEVMQKYSNAASQMNVIDQDTIHLLFPGLNKLLNFQRKFLIKLESIAELSWDEQRWGFPFTESEDDFAVYEPYCANYTTASDIMLQEMPNLGALDGVLLKSDLPAFLIKPVQRICKYPLLLESLLKAVKGTDYPFCDELKLGVDAAKRITDRINEAQRRAENDATVKNLEGRVEDWKGHHISNFGTLLLDDIFTVTKSEVDREYHVFLFEKIILCCKECLIPPPNGRKVGKSNSILKKPPAPPPLTLPGAGPSKKRNTPLLLKGRIFLNNVTRAEPKVAAGQYSLAVYWRGDDDLEFFTLRCRNEEQLKMWETQLNRLIQETANRRASERNPQRLAHLAYIHGVGHSNQQRQTLPSSYGSERERTNSVFSRTTSYTATSPYQSGPPRLPRHPYAAAGDEPPLPNSAANGSNTNGFGNGPQGYPPHDGFDVDLEDEYEEYPPTSLPPSGRGTPVGRPDYNGFPQSMRNSTHASAGGQFPPALTPGRPSISRSPASYAPDVSETSPIASRPALRSQFSSTRLRNPYDQAETRPNGSPRISSGVPAPLRSRSASQPSAYAPPQQMPPPPLPTSVPWTSRSQSSMGQHRKRGSGSSQSTTGESSDYSPQSNGSPITPFGSSESSLTNMSSSRTSRSQHSDQVVTSATTQLSGLVKVKVHFHEDIFVIQVPRATEYDELVEKVGKKIRLCGPRRDDGPLRVKYKDEDGDLVSLGSTEDVQMAFESFGTGNQVTLYVQ
ncbi:uncharacterized protein LAESUDRAFT_643658 [Laetiporus sulphureus 93-53]|uniref:RhoGEF-domain-containing protein n=1 Tax=Laetiporus sulphureus 93-53 TaxID=1314785 RepID=A0A165H096_9APHY|nr:uncharacterized protein LAESUDRAFT_643658 [Laetiporus sulphureus 93-53]KZT11071.1 hypothetical protein LAESUDRAFT_643658 [Laetiporus sulphureus 93-53]